MKGELKSPFAIVLSAIGVAIADNVVVATSASLPWITNRLYHAIFIGSVLMVLSIVMLIVTHKKLNISLQSEFMLIPFGVLLFGFFFDFFVLDYVRTLTFQIYGFSFITENAFSLAIYTVILFMFTILVLYASKKIWERNR